MQDGVSKLNHLMSESIRVSKARTVTTGLSRFPSDARKNTTDSEVDTQNTMKYYEIPLSTIYSDVPIIPNLSLPLRLVSATQRHQTQNPLRKSPLNRTSKKPNGYQHQSRTWQRPFGPANHSSPATNKDIKTFKEVKKNKHLNLILNMGKRKYIDHQGQKFDVPFKISEMRHEALPDLAAKLANVDTEPEEFGIGNPVLTVKVVSRG